MRKKLGISSRYVYECSIFPIFLPNIGSIWFLEEWNHRSSRYLFINTRITKTGRLKKSKIPKIGIWFNHEGSNFRNIFLRRGQGCK